MTDAGEHERDEPYNGPRDSNRPSIRDEEAPPPPHLKDYINFLSIYHKKHNYSG